MLLLLPRPLRVLQFFHSTICNPVNPHNSQCHYCRRNHTTDNKRQVCARIVLGQPTDQRDVDGHQDAEDQLEPANFFLESVDLCHRTVKVPDSAFAI